MQSEPDREQESRTLPPPLPCSWVADSNRGKSAVTPPPPPLSRSGFVPQRPALSFSRGFCSMGADARQQVIAYAGNANAANTVEVAIPGECEIVNRLLHRHLPELQKLTFFPPRSSPYLRADRRLLIICGAPINTGDGLISSRWAQRSGTSCLNGLQQGDAPLELGCRSPHWPSDVKLDHLFLWNDRVGHLFSFF